MWQTEKSDYENGKVLYTEKSAQGNPLMLYPEKGKHPLLGLRLFGRSTQNTVSGKNLYDIQNTVFYAPDYCSVDADGWVTVDYDNTEGEAEYLMKCPAPYNDTLVEGATYTIITEVEAAEGCYIYASSDYTGGSPIGQLGAYIKLSEAGTFKTVTTALEDFSVSDAITRCIVGATAGSVAHAKFRISVFAGEVDTFEYEPFTGNMASPNPDYPQEIKSVGDSGSITVSITDGSDAQILTTQTPNGLPGLPVKTDGLATYTDSNGQMWCADEVDLERGVYVQRIGLVESYNGEEITTDYMSTTGGLDTGATVRYILAEPIETPLTDEELSTYRSLHTNPVATMLSDAWMEVKYPCNIMYKPKTDWKWVSDSRGDFFNKEDYNRIIGNIEYLREMSAKVNPDFDTKHLDEKTSYADYIYADEFNTIEENLTKICKGTFPYTAEGQKTYYPNQPTPNYAELNRIESLLLGRYEFLLGQIAGRKTLSFMLGGGEF